MGNRQDIQRVWILGITHLELSDNILLDQVNDYPDVNFEWFPEVERVDVSYVQAWVNSQ